MRVLSIVDKVLCKICMRLSPLFGIPVDCFYVLPNRKPIKPAYKKANLRLVVSNSGIPVDNHTDDV